MARATLVDLSDNYCMLFRPHYVMPLKSCELTVIKYYDGPHVWFMIALGKHYDIYFKDRVSVNPKPKHYMAGGRCHSLFALEEQSQHLL
jgi:hypothetical protein